MEAGGWAMPRRLRQEPITAPLGVQPELDGKLQCLECGVWYRGLNRAGVRAARQAAAVEAGIRRKQRLDDWYAARARELGHADLDALFEATKDLTGAGLGELLGVQPEHGGRVQAWTAAVGTGYWATTCDRHMASA